MYKERRQRQSFLQKVAPLAVIAFVSIVASWICYWCYEHAELVWGLFK